MRADDEFLPAAGAGVRGADQSDLLAAEPQRLRAHTGLLAQREVEADRVSLSGPGGEPLPGDERHAAGGIGRHAEEADAPEPIDKDLYELEAEEKAKVKSTPGSLEEVLAALEKDHEFLLKGGVFTKDLIETWLEYKRKKELDAVRLRPHPYEFALYFDI